MSPQYRQSIVILLLASACLLAGTAAAKDDGGEGKMTEPLLNLFLPVDPTRACPGFFIGRVQTDFGSRGRWSMEIILSTGRRLLQGGLILGGTFGSAERPGFAAFNLANPQNEPQILSVDVEVEKDPVMVYRFEIVRREGNDSTIVASIDEVGPELSFERTLEPGFYSARIYSVGGSSFTTGLFTTRLATRFVDRPGGAFQGGVNVGGILGEGIYRSDTGFGALCISEPQTVLFRTFTLSAFGGSGASDLFLSVLDRERTVLDSMPPSRNAPFDPVDTYPNSCSIHAQLVGNGTAIGGSMNTDEDRDFFRLSVAEDGTTIRAFTTGNDLDTVGGIYDSQCNLLVAGDDGGEGNNFDIRTVVDAGSYHISVESFDNASSGDYTLHVEVF